MPGFSIRNPYFIVVICLMLLVIGATSLLRMPVDLFPPINLPEVVVATFYSGMPPEDVETDITDPLERFFTLASGVDHMESRSLLGREHHQGVLPAGNEPGCGCNGVVESGAGGFEAAAAGDAAPGGAEVRCLQLAGRARDCEGRRPERNAVARLRAVSDS